MEIHKGDIQLKNSLLNNHYERRKSSKVTPYLVLQGSYNQPGNRMLFKLKMFSVTFKTLKAIPSIDYH